MTYQSFSKCLNFEEGYRTSKQQQLVKECLDDLVFFFCLEHLDERIKPLIIINHLLLKNHCD